VIRKLILELLARGRGQRWPFQFNQCWLQFQHYGNVVSFTANYHRADLGHWVCTETLIREVKKEARCSEASVRHAIAALILQKQIAVTPEQDMVWCQN
jgi:hypothetical protein